MNSDSPKDDTATYSNDNELREITQRIQEHMKPLIPGDWNKARLLIRETKPKSEHFIEVAKPIWNPITFDSIEALPPEILEAIEELYLLFFDTRMHWIKCLIRLDRSRSGTWEFRADFAFFPNSNLDE